MAAQAQEVWGRGLHRRSPGSSGTSGGRGGRCAAIRPGEEVLDVACGTGNAAIRAALAGGRVVGVDLTPRAPRPRSSRRIGVGRRGRVAGGRRRGAAVRRRLVRRRPLDLRSMFAPDRASSRGLAPRAATRRALRALQLDAGGDGRRLLSNARRIPSPRPTGLLRPSRGATRIMSAGCSTARRPRARFARTRSSSASSPPTRSRISTSACSGRSSRRASSRRRMAALPSCGAT